MAPGTSCLFAKTRRRASFISRSWIMRASSVRASSRRSRSEESITKTRPCVPIGGVRKGGGEIEKVLGKGDRNGLAERGVLECMMPRYRSLNIPEK